LLRPDLPVSRRIQLRETTKAAFEADVMYSRALSRF
jgi:hypothetical protein